MGSCFLQRYLCLLHKSDNEQHLRHVLACTVGFFPSVHLRYMSNSRWEVFSWQGTFAPWVVIAVQALS